MTEENETQREFCTDCGDEFDAAIVRMKGKIIFHARVCEPCVVIEEAKAERRERPAGWIPLLDEIPAELADFHFNAMKDNARAYGDSANPAGRRIITGPTGAGKSYLSVALAMKRIEKGGRCLFTSGRAIKQTLFPTDSPITRERNGKLLDRLQVAKWACIDDVGHAKFTQPFGDLLLDIVNQRQAKGKSTVITSQFPPSEWVARFTTPTGSGCDKETIAAIVRRLDDYYDHWTL